MRDLFASSCQQCPAAVCIPVGTFSKGSSPQPRRFCSSLCRVHFRVRGLIRLLRKGMESHLSCQIQLCALLASKSGEIFHFPHFCVGFFCSSSPLFFCPLPLCRSSLVYLILFSILPPCACFLFFFSFFFLFPVGVVEGHSAHWLTFREGGGWGVAGIKDRTEQ